MQKHGVLPHDLVHEQNHVQSRGKTRSFPEA
jgi:hypothetical protein